LRDRAEIFESPEDLGSITWGGTSAMAVALSHAGHGCGGPSLWSWYGKPKPWAIDLDLSIYKTFKLGEGYPNVINLATAAQPGQEFGQITNNVNTPRQFQFGARFTFW